VPGFAIKVSLFAIRRTVERLHRGVDRPASGRASERDLLHRAARQVRRPPTGRGRRRHRSRGTARAGVPPPFAAFCCKRNALARAGGPRGRADPAGAKHPARARPRPAHVVQPTLRRFWLRRPRTAPSDPLGPYLPEVGSRPLGCGSRLGSLLARPLGFGSNPPYAPLDGVKDPQNGRRGDQAPPDGGRFAAGVLAMHPRSCRLQRTRRLFFRSRHFIANYGSRKQLKSCWLAYGDLGHATPVDPPAATRRQPHPPCPALLAPTPAC